MHLINTVKTSRRGVKIAMRFLTDYRQQILMRMRRITNYELLNFGLRIDGNARLSEFSSHTIDSN
jgi:hypothetical protein